MEPKDRKNYDVALIGVGVGANYGSVLTYYGLYRAVESFGKSVLMVSKIGASKNDPEIQNTHAIRFAKKWYNLSAVYSQDTVGQLNNIVDTFIVGSDQVWNNGVSRNFGKAFYLDFAHDDKRKLSYAASFGHSKDFTPPEEVPQISQLFKRFNAISVREESGVTLARDIYGVEARHVVDPIFLTPMSDYLDLAAHSERDTAGAYLLAYILDPTPEKKQAIEHIARSLGLGVRIILDGWPHLFEENRSKLDMHDQTEVGVETYDFLKLYANCSYVLTDSFHGTAFALKFGKPFVSIANRRRGIARFDSLFNMVGNRDRLTMDASNIVSQDARFLAPMDYDQINPILEQHVSESRAWLKAALERPIEHTISKESTVQHSEIARIKQGVGQKAARAGRDALNFISRSLSGSGTVRVIAPVFTASNDAWKSEAKTGFTRLTLTSPSAAIRGNLIWCDLPAAVTANTTCELTIHWAVRSAAPQINLHIRNPKTGKFKVIGSVKLPADSTTSRTDTFTFRLAESGFSQFMLGAVHFPGLNSGADIQEIILREAPGATLSPAPNAQRGKLDAEKATRALGKIDDDRFLNHYAHHRISRSVGNARSLMMFYAHGLEKGLSRTGNFRAGFGEASMPRLAEEMNKWLKSGGSPDDSFFRIAASVMHVYFARHRGISADVSHFRKLFDPAVQQAIDAASPLLGGAIATNVLREEPVVSAPRDFTDVVFGRRSVREFTDAPVDDANIMRAIEIALQAPSVCNRQPVRVHQFDDPDLMQAALDLQGGFRGYRMPPKLLLITSDQAAFIGSVERNQGFVDGGLFMMLLLLGLEQLNLGSCSLNTALTSDREAAIRKILSIPEGEVFISFVAVGHYEQDLLVPRSKRISADEILLRHSSGH